MDSDERSVYVAQLHDDFDEQLLEELFLQAGPLKNFTIKEVRGSEARFAIVEFEHEESVLFAIEILNGIKVFGIPLVVKPRNRTKQEELYRAKRAEIEQRNPPTPRNSSSSRDSGRQESRHEYDRDRDSRYQNYDRGSDRRSHHSNSRDSSSSWRHQSQNQNGNWRERGHQDDSQYSTPQALPHREFVNQMLQHSAPPAYNGRWQHQPPPPPPPPRNNYQTPHRQHDRHGFDRNNYSRNSGGWKNDRY